MQKIQPAGGRAAAHRHSREDGRLLRMEGEYAFRWATSVRATEGTVIFAREGLPIGSSAPWVPCRAGPAHDHTTGFERFEEERTSRGAM